MTDLQGKIDDLERLRQPMQRVPGRDLADYSRRELLSQFFDVPLEDWQVAALNGNQEILDRVAQMNALLSAAVEALKAGDADRADVMMRDRLALRVDALVWMSRQFRAAARQAKLQELNAMRFATSRSDR